MSTPVLPTTRRFVSTGSGEISYLDTADPAEPNPAPAPAALFLHGVGTNATLWRNVIASIGRAPGRPPRRCLALDLPLHGDSPAHAEQDFSLDGLAQVLEDFLTALDLERVDLIANDTGGAVAQVFAARHPNRLRTLTLTNCDTHDNLPPEAFRPIVELAANGQFAPAAVTLVTRPELARSGALGAGYEHPEQVPDDVLHGYLRPVCGTLDSARQFERLLVSLRAEDLVAIEPQLRQLAVPTLLVWGDADENFELHWAHWLRDTLPNVVDLVEVPGGKLFFPEERPDELVPHLLRLWAS